MRVGIPQQVEKFVTRALTSVCLGRHTTKSVAWRTWNKVSKLPFQPVRSILVRFFSHFSTVTCFSFEFCRQKVFTLMEDTKLLWNNVLATCHLPDCRSWRVSKICKTRICWLTIPRSKTQGSSRLFICKETKTQSQMLTRIKSRSNCDTGKWDAENSQTCLDTSHKCRLRLYQGLKQNVKFFL